MHYLLITLFSNCKDLSDQRQRLADSSIMFKFGCVCFFKVALTRSITNALRVIRRGQRWVRCMKTKLRFSCEDDFCFTVNDSEHSNWKYLETFLILVSAIMNG